MTEIPPSERWRWRLAPPSMNYREADAWARDELGSRRVIRLSTGETLVQLPLSPWAL